MGELKEKEYYKVKIHEMVEKIENVWILNQIMEFIHNMTKED